MTIRHFVLDPDDTVREATLTEWAMWLEAQANQVAVDRLGAEDDPDRTMVSTVFVGIDLEGYGLAGGKGWLLETRIFGGPHDMRTWRYMDVVEARTEHARIVAALRAKETP